MRNQHKFLSLLFALTGISNIVFSQVAKQDSITNLLDEVVVTATKTERKADILPIYTSVISKKQISKSGSLRLSNILEEQAGLTIINDHGEGLQVQGFAPEYTMILIDGEPLIGRTAGTLSLDRVAVGNIKQIEVVKGPTSCLYGNEALAGIVNIITEKIAGTTANLKMRYGTNNTSNISGALKINKNQMGLYLFADQFASSGYDLNKEVYGKTVDPFTAYTFNTKFNYAISKKMDFNLSGRYYLENQTGAFKLNTDFVKSSGNLYDYNLAPSLTYKATEKLKLALKFYTSRYKTTSKTSFEKNDSLFNATFFIQNYKKPELTFEYNYSKKHNFISGVGYINETVEATRYNGMKKMATYYGFLNYEFNTEKKWGIVAGTRFDKHSVYGSQMSPKLAVSYRLNKWALLRANIGAGFKAPDFRQLYLNFTNASAGYTVLGVEEVHRGIANLQERGQIAEVLVNPALLGTINAESSVAFNLGSSFTLKNNTLKGNVNLFRNNISGLIETQAIALKTTGQYVYSYRNLSKVFTQGLEADCSYRPFSFLTIAVGYQYLEAKDLSVLKNVKQGNVYRRNPTTQATTRVQRNEYAGLFNRSKHSGNMKLWYQNQKHNFDFSIRCIYRGQFGLSDKNNNQILDADYEFVKGYPLFNITGSKTIYNKITFQAGIDNVFDFKNKSSLPGIAGRLWFVSASYEFIKKQNLITKK